MMSHVEYQILNWVCLRISIAMLIYLCLPHYSGEGDIVTLFFLSDCQFVMFIWASFKKQQTPRQISIKLHINNQKCSYAYCKTKIVNKTVFMITFSFLNQTL